MSKPLSAGRPRLLRAELNRRLAEFAAAGYIKEILRAVAPMRALMNDTASASWHNPHTERLPDVRRANCCVHRLPPFRSGFQEPAASGGDASAIVAFPADFDSDLTGLE